VLHSYNGSLSSSLSVRVVAYVLIAGGMGLESVADRLENQKAKILERGVVRGKGRSTSSG
jgi:hypothetical protein